MGLTRALALDGILPADLEPQGVWIALRDDAGSIIGERRFLLPVVFADKPTFKMPIGLDEYTYRKTDLRTPDNAVVYVAEATPHIGYMRLTTAVYCIGTTSPF